MVYSYIGLLGACPLNDFENKKKELIFIQNTLFEIGALLASKKNTNGIHLDSIQRVETFIDQIELKLEPLRSFILPGGNMWSSYAQISRSICRRAERRVTALNVSSTLDINIVKFLNRLSDYLFVLARYINHIDNMDEIKWNG